MIHNMSSFVRRASATAVCLLLVAGAGTASAAPSTKTVITVLIDSPRGPFFQQYQKTHPNLDIKIDVTSQTQILPDVRLAIAAHSGVPDVIWGSASSAALAGELQVYGGSLEQYVPPSVQAKFVPGSNQNCIVNGVLLCIRNDISQSVIWVNTKLMKQFGYTEPTTWQQFEQIGLQVAKQHPGYGFGGFAQYYEVMDMYYSAFKCPFSQLLSLNTVRIDMSAPGCEHMYSTLDPLFKAGVLNVNMTLSGPDAAQFGQSGKLLMQYGPSWWGDYTLKTFYHVPTGQYSALAPLSWGSEPAVTGQPQGGGGVYMVYKNSPVFAQAAQMILSIDTDISGPTGIPTRPTYPAWGPGVAAWTASTARNKFYSENPVPALNKAAAELSPTFGAVRYDYSDIYNSIIMPGLQSGKSLAQLAPQVQSALVKIAKQTGYKVVTSP
jgi:ABC-type glycerol-3-phosphate transport system substrate-binding protein